MFLNSDLPFAYPTRAQTRHCAVATPANCSTFTTRLQTKIQKYNFFFNVALVDNFFTENF